MSDTDEVKFQKHFEKTNKLVRATITVEGGDTQQIIDEFFTNYPISHHHATRDQAAMVKTLVDVKPLSWEDFTKGEVDKKVKRLIDKKEEPIVCQCGETKVCSVCSICDYCSQHLKCGVR